MIRINDVIDELLKFSPSALTLSKGVDEDKINEFEHQHGLLLPNDYKTFLKWSNGIELIGVRIFGLYNDAVFSSLEGAYKIEHNEVENLMPFNLIPFSPDGGGNHYCFDYMKCDEQSCKIIFWQYDLSYTDINPPEVVNNSFAEWVQEVLIDWTLEDYDYDGNEKIKK